MSAVMASAQITNEIGLHARPSVKLTQLAKKFSAKLEVATSQEGPWVDAKSPVKIMRLKAVQGETLFFRAKGNDATDALGELAALVSRKFDEA